MVEQEPKRKRVESLGWLTESSIMPRKQRAIEGVGPSSIVELKAELYKSQQESIKSRDVGGRDVSFHRAKAKISPSDPFSLKNAGVEARAHKDKLELKAVNDGSACSAALEKKAALYDKLSRGELSDEEDNEKYCVDFFNKSHMQDESRQSQVQETFPTLPPENDGSETEASGLFNMKPVGLGRTTGARDQDEHIRFVREVHEEANKAREKASALKLRREEEASARREKLKQALIRAKLDKLRATAKSDCT